MYYKVFGEKVSKRRYKEMCEAAKNRRELIAAGLTSRRDLFKRGLLTAGGVLIAEKGLSAQTLPSSQNVGGRSVKTNNPPRSGQNMSPATNQTREPGTPTAR